MTYMRKFIQIHFFHLYIFLLSTKQKRKKLKYFFSFYFFILLSFSIFSFSRLSSHFFTPINQTKHTLIHTQRHWTKRCNLKKTEKQKENKAIL